ncbi:MAG: hypothetical protein M1834_002655 [Cirrosporium novae-zelandiae]|nr:MAG: hypothetical protein M1834_002655 [Cirrosporium novae-zelandiae]
MWFLYLSLYLVWVTFAIAIPFNAHPSKGSLPDGLYNQSAIDSGEVLQHLLSRANEASLERLTRATNKTDKLESSTGCNPSTLTVRREWRTLSSDNRRSYIAAVQCLQSKPSVYEPKDAPGVKSLYDSFVATHINQTLVIHNTASFLTWHRFYVWTYDQALRTECGYAGPTPYWDWSLDIDSPRDSPMFDGSDTSFGSDGKYFEHEGVIFTSPPGAPSTPPLSGEPGTGGGCIFKGPFVNYTVNLGPVNEKQFPNGPNITYVPSTDLLAYNPHCLRRDLNPWVAQSFASFNQSTSVILEYDTIEYFQAFLEGDLRYVQGTLGIHGGGHFTVGGDHGDTFSSPVDPVFFLHHGNIDRVYSIWQGQNFENRQGIFGTRTFYNSPPSDNGTVDDYLTLQLGNLTKKMQIRDAMDTVGGTPFCYIYA